MQTFIEYLIQEAYKNYEDVSKQCVFILPSKRAALFLKKAITKNTNTTILSPEIYSIEDFVEKISGLSTANTTTQLFELYTVYKKVGDYEKEDFNSFLKWGQTLLQDFNEIDRYLVDSSKLYQNISAIQELNHWSLAEEKTEMIQNYIHFWKHLETIYKEFNSSLLKNGLGHQGLIYRTAVTSLDSYLTKNTKSHIFAGFNALNLAEITIIQKILSLPKSKIYWDLDNYFLEDDIHDASYFIRAYRKTWDVLKNKSIYGISENYLKTKNINVIGVPKNISQLNYVGNLITTIKQKNPGELKNVAIILGNEDLLNPLINTIPENISAINITMGQKLETTTLANFFITILEFHENKTKNGWFYKNVLHLLTHSYTIMWLESLNISVERLVETIQINNWSYINHDQLNTLFSKTSLQTNILFDDENKDPNKIIDNLSKLIVIFKEIALNTKSHLLLEELYKFHNIFNQLQALSSKFEYIKTQKSLKQIFKQLLSTETLDFQGDPVEGIQIMGMLESRLLDFETVIITSVNEGILPSGKSNNSFIPFDLKSAHGLPTYKEKDAVYTYHFYRILQRAKNVYLLYNTEPDVLDGGERSRLITQLLTDKNRTDIIEHIASPQIQITNNNKQSIVKTADLQKLIQAKSLKGYSPSSLSNYIRNPLSFYKQNLLNINDVMLVEETLAANTFGTIVHDSLEELYTPFIGTYLQPDLLEKTKNNIHQIVTQNFQKSYKEGNITNGKNFLSFHVILKYIQTFIDHEIFKSKEQKIKIIGLETDLKISLDVPGLDNPVVLKGKLDRIEERDGITTIIDYKTGKVESKNVEIQDWEVLTTEYQYSKAFQLLCYALMFQKTIPNKEINLQAGIISFKNFKDGTLLFAKKESARGAKKYIIDNEILLKFKEVLFDLIQQIHNPSIPFLEKEI